MASVTCSRPGRNRLSYTLLGLTAALLLSSTLAVLLWLLSNQKEMNETVPRANIRDIPVVSMETKDSVNLAFSQSGGYVKRTSLTKWRKLRRRGRKENAPIDDEDYVGEEQRDIH
ncbi:Hypp7130 [Branchiostoma lanceolatum]|uniref:Hypp7130 protein n=1 Tax=Branchiostoma lanceolatum TaxID=7740 RepID=A0A8K0E6T7_BRALA|nr:Hypp7130 [Branchiostoma lanceolatum]